MYRFVDAVLLRMTMRSPTHPHPGWPDLTVDPPDDAAVHGEHVELWRRWLDEVWADEEFVAAVELASPALTDDVQRFRDGHALPTRHARRVVASVVKYLLRAANRPTPFGLFAGVVPVRVGPSTRFRIGSGHRAATRVETEWLEQMIARLEGCPGLRPGLAVVVNNLAVVRDGRLVLNPARGSESVTGAATTSEMSLRFSRAVQTAVRAARSPIRLGDLADVVLSEFPDVSAAAVDTMLVRLVEHRILLTCLRPPMSVTDPLGHVIEHAARALNTDPDRTDQHAAHLLAELQRLHRDLHDLGSATAPHSSGRTERRAATTRMATLAPGQRLLTADVRLDATVVLPPGVLREAEAAAAALTRVTPTPSGAAAWRDYHRRFLDRYGIGALVPVSDVVNADTGLGFPAGFRDSLMPVAAPQLRPRDVTLLAVAQRAAVEQTLEIVLHEVLLAKLEDGAVETAPRQPHTELTCQVQAASRDDLDAGRFLLSVIGVSRSAGTTSGRFLDLLEPADQQRMTAAYRALPAARDGALVAQVSCPPLNPRAENIARHPHVMSHRICLGEHHTPDPGLVEVADLAVTGDLDGLWLFSMSREQPVEPLSMSAVEPSRSAHPMQRFLSEINLARAALSVPFSWGAARHLPFLPRIRHGRTILAPARWRLTHTDLTGRAAPARGSTTAVSDAALARWRSRYRVPDTVDLGGDDRRLRLDLTEPAHRHLLRAALTRHGEVVLRESPHPDAFGWADGRAHELVVPLASTQSPTRPRGPIPRSTRPSCVEDGHLPGASPWLFATITAHPHRHTAILTTHLPTLLTAWDSEPQWWFLRHHDPEPHLRLRIRLTDAADFGVAARRVGAWAQELRHRGLIGQIRFDTYHPETGRFGAGSAMTAAEEVFATDSAAAVAQLRSGLPPRAVLAASAVDLATAIIGGSGRGLRWCVDHLPRTAPAPDRALRGLAIQLTAPHDGYASLRSHPHGERIAHAWRRRRAALTAYCDILRATTDGPVPESVLPDLLHLHHARTIGLDPDSERACLHLARAAALSWTTRTRNAA